MAYKHITFPFFFFFNFIEAVASKKSFFKEISQCAISSSRLTLELQEGLGWLPALGAARGPGSLVPARYCCCGGTDGTDRLTDCNNFVYWGARGEHGCAPLCISTYCKETDGS